MAIHPAFEHLEGNRGYLNSLSKSPESETTVVPVCLRKSSEVVMIEPDGELECALFYVVAL